MRINDACPKATEDSERLQKTLTFLLHRKKTNDFIIHSHCQKKKIKKKLDFRTLVAGNFITYIKSATDRGRSMKVLMKAPIDYSGSNEHERQVKVCHISRRSKSVIGLAC